MINYILLFIAYFALTSILHWWVNRPQYMTIKGIKRPLSDFGGPSLLVPLFKNNYQMWADDLEKSFPDYGACKSFANWHDEAQQSTEIHISYICHNCHKEHYFEPDQLPGGEEHCPYCEVCGGRLLKNESRGCTNFYKTTLGIPWKDGGLMKEQPASINDLEEKFKKDFDERFGGMAIVEDITTLSPLIRNNAVDRWHIRIWIDQWILNNADLDNDFKRTADSFLEKQFNR